MTKAPATQCDTWSRRICSSTLCRRGAHRTRPGSARRRSSGPPRPCAAGRGPGPRSASAARPPICFVASCILLPYPGGVYVSQATALRNRDPSPCNGTITTRPRWRSVTPPPTRSAACGSIPPRRVIASSRPAARSTSAAPAAARSSSPTRRRYLTPLPKPATDIGGRLHLPDASRDPPGRPRQLPDLRHGAGAARRSAAEPRGQSGTRRHDAGASGSASRSTVPVVALGHAPASRVQHELAAARPGDAGRAVGRLAVLPARLGLAAPPQPQHVHADRPGHRCGLGLQHRRDDRARPVPGRLPLRTAGSRCISRPRRSSPSWSCWVRCWN